MVEVLLVFLAIVAVLSLGLFLWAVVVNTTNGPLWALLALALVMFELMDVALFLGRRQQEQVSGFSPALLIAGVALLAAAFVLWCASWRATHDHTDHTDHPGHPGHRHLGNGAS